MGGTIRSLKPEEAIMFKVALTECEGCDMPKSIEINIKAATLVDYNMDKLSRDAALSQLKVKKIK